MEQKKNWRESLLEKIKKIFRLANKAGTKDEAETAVSMAYDIMARHNIAEREINIEEKQEKPTEKIVLESETPTEIWARQVLAQIIQPYYGIIWWFSDNGKKLRIWGQESQVEIASYVYGFIINTFKSLWEYKKTQMIKFNEFDHKQYMFGLIKGLAEKLESQKKVVQSETGKEVAIYVPPPPVPLMKINRNFDKYTEGGLYQEGMVDGANVNLYDGIKNGRTITKGLK